MTCKAPGQTSTASLPTPPRLTPIAGPGRPEATFLLERLDRHGGRRGGQGPGGGEAHQPDSKVRERPRRLRGSDLRQRRLRSRAGHGPRPCGLRRTARGAGGEPRARPLHRHRRFHLLRDMRPWPVPSCRGRGLRRRTVGKRGGALPPVGQGQRLRRRLAPRTGRGDHLRPGRFRHAGRSRRGRGDSPRRHRQHAHGLGHLRQPHHGSRRGSPAAGPEQDKGQGPRPGGPPAGGRRGPTSSMPTASSSSEARPTRASPSRTSL